MINWVIAYLLFGAFFALVGNYGMLESDRSKRYKLRITLGLFFAWPFMIGWVLLTALVFIVMGGLF